VRESFNNVKYESIRLMFQDEAGFGRINKPRYCWAKRGMRPSVPCHHIREYRYAYGAVEPFSGESFFLVLPYNNTDCMNLFLAELTKKYPNDYIILVLDGATWHRSGALCVPDNIELIYLPPATPEMNPIEQIWTWIRRHGFGNEIFKTLENVIDRLCETIRALSSDTVKSITSRQWIIDCF
jgi:putative transposase